MQATASFRGGGGRGGGAATADAAPYFYSHDEHAEADAAALFATQGLSPAGAAVLERAREAQDRGHTHVAHFTVTRSC